MRINESITKKMWSRPGRLVFALSDDFYDPCFLADEIDLQPRTSGESLGLLPKLLALRPDPFRIIKKSI